MYHLKKTRWFDKLLNRKINPDKCSSRLIAFKCMTVLVYLVDSTNWLEKKTQTIKLAHFAIIKYEVKRFL